MIDLLFNMLYLRYCNIYVIIARKTNRISFVRWILIPPVPLRIFRKLLSTTRPDSMLTRKWVGQVHFHIYACIHVCLSIRLQIMMMMMMILSVGVVGTLTGISQEHLAISEIGVRIYIYISTVQ